MIELLVSLTVVGIVLALVVPGLVRSRESGRSTACKSSLRELGQDGAVFAADYKDAMPNVFLRSEFVVTPDLANFEMDDAVMGVGYFSQVYWWQGSLIDYAFERAGGGVPGCPTAARLLGAPSGSRVLSYSYFYPTTNFTQWRLWEPAAPDRRTHSNDFREYVRISAVATPSRKALLLESATYHERSPAAIWTRPAGSVNAVAVDGSAGAWPVSSIPVALSYDQEPSVWMGASHELPTCGSPNGYLGVDR